MNASGIAGFTWNLSDGPDGSTTALSFGHIERLNRSL